MQWAPLRRLAGTADGADKWWKFDDDAVTPVTTDDILKLDGGGDWHMAYLCLYRERTLPLGYSAPADKPASAT